MKTLNIDSSITDSIVDLERLITSNNISSYNFISANICIELEIEGKKHTGTLQTGHLYNLGDYSLPSNTLSLYEGDYVLEQMDAAYALDFERSGFIEELNEDSGCSYTDEQWLSIYEAFNDAVNEAQGLVNDKEREADEALREDSAHYVTIVEMEANEVAAGVFQSQQCQERYTLKFNTSEEAEKEIESRELNGDRAYSIDKEQGVSERHEHLSNF